RRTLAPFLVGMGGANPSGSSAARVLEHPAVVPPRRFAVEDGGLVHSSAVGRPIRWPRSTEPIASRGGTRGARVVPPGRKSTVPDRRAPRPTSPANPGDREPGPRVAARGPRPVDRERETATAGCDSYNNRAERRLGLVAGGWEASLFPGITLQPFL